MRKYKFLLTIFFLALSLSSCTSYPSPNSNNPTDVPTQINLSANSINEANLSANSTSKSTLLASCANEPSMSADHTNEPSDNIILTVGSKSFTFNSNSSSNIIIDNNIPNFTNEKIEYGYEYYSELDSLDRCGVSFACIGPETIPTEERGQIGMVQPSGWHTVKYDIVDGNYLYNRCHLIGYQLSGENANERNLITGTRYMNIEGMLLYENMVAEYVENTENHVLYRVTPIFYEDELLARGVQMEAESIEDDGLGIRFNIFVPNVQPGITIDYASGDSYLTKEGKSTREEVKENGEKYILNINSFKIHTPKCESISDMSGKNKKEYIGDINKLLENGYSKCKNCNPE